MAQIKEHIMAMQDGRNYRGSLRIKLPDGTTRTYLNGEVLHTTKDGARLHLYENSATLSKFLHEAMDKDVEEVPAKKKKAPKKEPVAKE